MPIKWKRFEFSDESDREKFRDYYITEPKGLGAIVRRSRFHMYEVFVKGSVNRDAYGITFNDAKRKARKLIKERMLEEL